MSFCYSSVRIYCQGQRVLAFLFGKPIRLFAHKEKGNLFYSFHNVVLNMIDQIKAVLLMVYSALSGFFLPIHDFIVAILILLGMNFVSGWIEDSLHAWRLEMEKGIPYNVGMLRVVWHRCLCFRDWPLHAPAERSLAVPNRNLCGCDLVLLYQYSQQLEEDSDQGYNALPIHQFLALACINEVRGKDSVSFRVYKP